MPAPNRSSADSTEAPTLYLVFAGLHGQSRRGTSDLVATLASQSEAREAFRQIRLQIPDRDGWAELTAVSAGGKAKRLGWFGGDRPPGNSPATWLLANSNRGGQEEDTAGRSRRWHIRRRGAPPSSTPVTSAVGAGRTSGHIGGPGSRSLRRTGEAR